MPEEMDRSRGVFCGGDHADRAGVPLERDVDVMRGVGRRVAELRAERGLTQQEAADALEMALKSYQRIEAGAQNLTLRTLVRVAGAFGARAVDLLSAPVSHKVRRGRPRKTQGEVSVGEASGTPRRSPRR